MAIVGMEDAFPGQVASSAEYNKLIDNIQDLDTRVTQNTADIETIGTLPAGTYFGSWTDDAGGSGQSISSATKVTAIGVPVGTPSGCEMSAGTFTPHRKGKWMFTVSTQYNGGNSSIRALFLSKGTATTNPTGIRYGLFGGPSMDAQATSAVIELDFYERVSVYVAVWGGGSAVTISKQQGNNLTAVWLGP